MPMHSLTYTIKILGLCLYGFISLTYDNMIMNVVEK